MYKVCVCGHFGGDNNFNDGQTVKTKNLYTALSEIYGEKAVLKIDTYNWKKHPISFLNECKKRYSKFRKFNNVTSTQWS